MKKRRLGRSDLEVAPFCFGGNVFGWTADEKTSFALLDAFVDAGFDFFDTADAYSRWVPGHSGGESETIIGRWMKARGNRDKVIIATKVGADMGSGRTMAASYVRKAVEASLKRLQTDRIDLYQTHWDDPKTPLEEVLSTYADLIKAGKVRVIGASNYSAARLKQALEVSASEGLPRYESLQPQYNLVERKDYESELGPLCRKEQIGVIPYYSLASGFLTGKYRSRQDAGKSPRGSGATKYLDERGLRVLAALDEVASAHQASVAQVALAWLLAKPELTAPIASATSVAQLQELLGAVRLELSQADIGRLDAASA
ncbi:MAG: aldo/keto reductase [Methylobacteriaceae bacterium]|nr:aldo/keto reductase [Methylobacteriaceae bacterium]